MENTSSAFLIYLCSTIVGIFLGALVLQFATKWVAGFKPKYPVALMAAFIGFLASFAIGFLVGFFVGMANKGQLTGTAMVFILFGGFFAQTGFYALIIKDADRKPLPYGKACLVSLIQVVFAAAILAAVWGAMTITNSIQATAGNEFDGQKRLAENGDAQAQCYLGYCYYNGQGVTTNLVESVKWFRKAAEQNHAQAQWYLGVCYYYGNGVAVDYAEAAKWYRRAADQGNADAEYDLGHCYFTGQGAPLDYEEAAKWYRKAADQGDLTAQSQLAQFYLSVLKDDVDAVKWYRRAANQNDAYAQDVLGYCYANGRGVTTNLVEAYEWYNLASAQGYVNGGYTSATTERDALAALMTPDQIAQAQRLSSEFQSHKESASEAAAKAALDSAQDSALEAKKMAQADLKLFEENKTKAEKGDAGSQNYMGYCYFNGRNVPLNYAEAVKWYRMAADQGNADAENNLGHCYFTGQGVPQDYGEAVKWYRRSAEQNNTAAQWNLGYCYLYGYGVTKNLVEAYKWYYLINAQDSVAGLQLEITHRQVAEAQRLAREFQSHRESASSNSK